MAEPLTEMFWSYIQTSVSSGGFSTHPGIVMDRAEKLTVLAMALDPEQIYSTMLLKVLSDQAPQAIFAIDRFAKEGQGTKYPDLLAGHWLANGKWRQFIIEYQLEPMIVEPINFDNLFWNGVLMRELRAHLTYLFEGAAAAEKDLARG